MFTCAAADIKNYLIRNEMLVIVDEVSICIRADRILEHGLVDICGYY